MAATLIPGIVAEECPVTANLVSVQIDGVAVQVPERTTILKAARQAGVGIPTLCYLDGINEIGSCRVCVVEVEGVDTLLAACNTQVHDGMVVRTNTPRVIAARRTNVELLLSQHDVSCTDCVRGGNCTLQSVSADLGIVDVPFPQALKPAAWDKSFPLIRDANKCIKCQRCVAVCGKVQASDIWALTGRASRSNIGVAGGIQIDGSKCALCGQCITHCPVGALRERDDTRRVFQALADPDRIALVQVAPSVRTSWGEHLGLAREEATEQLLAGVLRRLGFDYVFDTDWSADLTIMEEANEFLERLAHKDEHAFPMFTSCCPGWIRFLKAHYPHMVDQLSTAKSPQGMFGAVAKSWFAQRAGLDADRIFSLSVMPCLAKKHECALDSLNDAGHGADVDCVLTVRELVRMVRAAGIDPRDVEPCDFDQPLGNATGAGVIFGATGGVMEAALRTAYFAVAGRNPDPDAFKDVRGHGGWKEETFEIDGTPLRVAIAHGLGNAKRLLDALDAGDVAYDFVEVMACPGGCVGGGGQPIHDGQELQAERAKVLYDLDAGYPLRFSHENPTVRKCYEEFMDAPVSETAEHYLHTDHHAWSMPHR